MQAEEAIEARLAQLKQRIDASSPTCQDYAAIQRIALGLTPAFLGLSIPGHSPRKLRNDRRI